MCAALYNSVEKKFNYQIMASSETVNGKMFSIIMATYNCGQKIENTLQSIFSQNKELFELIVIDGASTDNTLEYLKKYESSLTLISEKDDGIYSAFNKGIEIATGKYIYFIGAGDYLRPNILEQVKEFLPPETPTLVYGNVYFTKHKFFNGREFSSSDFTWTNICHQGEFYHRAIFDIVGKYDLRYKVFADWLLNLKCFLHQGINKRYIPLHIADYEEGGLSSRISNDPAFKRDFPRFVKKELGIKAFIICQAKMRNPDALYFTHSLGYGLLYETLLRPLIPVARPFVRGYRSLKKTITNSK
jgi:glycosyltransferase involved in cell wall biosynthesis